MERSIQAVCEEFSRGNFPAVYPYLSETIEWNFVGAKPIVGKAVAIDALNKLIGEMNGAGLNNTNVIVSETAIVIEGFCDYEDDKNEPAKLYYCDVYTISGDVIEKISSYGVESKE